MDQRVARCVSIMGVVMILIIIGFGIYFSTTTTWVGVTEPLNMTSITHKWFCKNGKAFPISTSKIVAVCKGEYVDIRQVINHRATIKGIQLTVAEWKQLNEIINDVNTIL